ncbi:1,4-alpha-glucan branching enzyme [Desulfofundulus luciae]|uniref:1,4-alpha-glucan branching enzyme n=1 Tax=Desulfofundulus luciae TaxID=74702 RepID=A0ABU0B2N4_9FIRM|nr:1,4-alpha-glucan branching protein domain-containing protein [Desulfofundulus luciae]MDQ0286985.1 1,4-alpha-glucan branching enzyme [Desulfofundulus luciae]
MPAGYLALVLHAHLPYVRHPEMPECLEERWFFEALTECYIPLVEVLQGLVRDGVSFQLTISLSPPLLAMLADPLLQKRYLNHLEAMIQLGEAECRRTAEDTDLHPLALMYLEKLNEVRRAYTEKYQCDLIGAFRNLQKIGRVELITTCATHGYLPLMQTREARRAQIGVGVEFFARHFGGPPDGFWLPECGYAPGVEELLKEFGIRYFFVETHGLLYAEPAPRYGVFAPASCANGVAVFGRDPESSRQVWDRQTGYPGDYFYREFYRDIGYDLDVDYLRPYLPAGTIRVDTGFKYYRITGPGPHKEPYRPELARERAAEHAAHFLFHRQQQVLRHGAKMDRPALVVAPYDAELFGHWWYEGPQWIDLLSRRICFDQDVIQMITPGQYLSLHPDLQVVDLPMSSWGEGGYNRVWLNPSNDWIYRHLHRAEAVMADLADLHPDASGVKERALNQAARELLLAQSSDWAFIIRTETAVEYARKRLTGHIGRFNLLTEQLEKGCIDEAVLQEMEYRDNIFPHLDYRIYSRHRRYNVMCVEPRPPLRILMLSWEYPPATVGGLARHVYDLSRALARLGDEVHVITCPVAGEEAYSLQQGVHVHRLLPEQLGAKDFLTWVKQLNEGMITLAHKVIATWGMPHLVHAHDWMVGAAGDHLRERYGFPLVATIHATEYGRNRGIRTDLQRRIHEKEYLLTQGATLVICCSNYMAEEVSRLFGLDREKVKVIPNGVDPVNLTDGRTKEPDCKDLYHRDPNIVFLGRLVPEKGVQVLLEALASISERVEGARLLVAGRGPYEEYLKGRVEELGLSPRVQFVGFVDDLGRNRLLEMARVAVFPSLYEPFGIVALEAMAARVPVVVADTGGLGEIVEHGVDGYKVPPGRADMLAHYITRLLFYPELAVEMCRRAWRKVITFYDWQYIAEETHQAYCQAMATTGSPVA